MQRLPIIIIIIIITILYRINENDLKLLMIYLEIGQ